MAFTAASALAIATCLSASHADTNAPGGPQLTIHAQTLAGPQTGLSDASYDAMVWLSGRLGWLFGDRFFHGPEIEAGYQQFTVRDLEVSVTRQQQYAHFGLAYRVGVDAYRWRDTALWLGARLSVGVTPVDRNSLEGVVNDMFFQQEVSLGCRAALGPVTLAFELGPSLGIYSYYLFAMVHTGLTVGLRPQ